MLCQPAFKDRKDPISIDSGHPADGGSGGIDPELHCGVAARQVGCGFDLHYGGQRHRGQVYWQGEGAHVFAPHGATRILEIDLLAHAGDHQADAGRLTAPMPGKVLSFAVKAGDKVRKGQPLAVMEAMKMEHTIAAPADGVVSELLFAPGDQVGEGAELLKIGA